ncbi:MAG: hypothetical protein ACSHWY_11955 [Octadecabacter sp.]
MIVHAGFHKTGTTSAQHYLRANGKHLWKRCALVLSGKLRNNAAKMAVRYSRYGTDGLLDQYEADLYATLSALDMDVDGSEDRKLLISDENLSGRMPGRDGQMDYGATPALMARTEDVICDVFGVETDVIFVFTTRAPDAWLHSTYKHNLRTSRLTMDAAEYAETFRAAADLNGAAQAVAAAVTGAVYTVDIADLTGVEGPAQPLIDLIDLPPHRRAALTPHPVQNIGPHDGVIADFLALNRSDLTDDALRAAKKDLLGKADNNDG